MADLVYLILLVGRRAVVTPLVLSITIQGFDPYSTTCFRNTTHLVAILGSLATNVIIGSDMWALWPPKLYVALVISFVARRRR